MAEKFKDRRGNAPPSGAFSGARPGPEEKPPVAAPVAPRTPTQRLPTFSFPPPSASGPLGSEELVFEDDLESDTPKTKSASPPPLGQSEGHDAWMMDRMSRQSTVPPVRRDDVDRLRELSALPLGELPDQQWGGALDLVDRSRPLLPPDLVGEMEELYALDDLSGALRHAELILGRVPDHEQANRCAANCRTRLIQLYSSKIGRLDRVVVQAMGDSQVRWLGLDHRSGFLLSRVDGVCTLEELLDVCGMPRLEALKTLADLLDRGAIRFE